MRHHLEIIKDIEAVLSLKRVDKELAELRQEIRASSTGSELCLRVGTWLSSNERYDLKQLREEFELYCHSNGLYPGKH
jgi:hypothetical protein